MQPKKISRSITKYVDLRVGVARAFDFLNDPENWPKWAIVNMKSVKPATDGWYDTETRQGKGQLKMLSNKPLSVPRTERSRSLPFHATGAGRPQLLHSPG